MVTVLQLDLHNNFILFYTHSKDNIIVAI